MGKQWQHLKPKSKVRIIAPAGRLSDPWSDLDKCCELLQSWELEPIVNKNNIFGNYDSFYNFANAPDIRFRDLVDALHSDADAIWCYRGGYGSRELVELLIKHNVQPPAQPKLFIGFSDVTDLHSYFNRAWNWNTLHAAVIRPLALKLVSTDTEELIKKIMFGSLAELQISLTSLNQAAKQSHDIYAAMCGGNLTTLQTAIGTAWEMDCAGKIILLEDIGEVPYRIDRIFKQFLNSQYLHQAKAIVLGDFLGTDTMTFNKEKMDNVLQNFADQCPIPVLRREGIGHGKENYPIAFNTKASLALGEQAQLVIVSGFM